MQTVLKTKVKVNHCALSECRWHGDCYLSVCAAAVGSGCIIEAVTFGFYKKREMFFFFLPDESFANLGGHKSSVGGSVVRLLRTTALQPKTGRGNT